MLLAAAAAAAIAATVILTYFSILSILGMDAVFVSIQQQHLVCRYDMIDKSIVVVP